MSRLRSDNITLAYGEAPVVDALDLTVPDGEITTIIGPNGCGKSTLLRTCGRLLRPSDGKVRLNGQDVRRGRHHELSRRLALLSQGPTAPAGFLVEDLVASGRVPHQGLLRQWRAEDEAVIEDSLAHCNLADLRFREVESLSGGQRQRAWFGMALAQDTPVLLLDEPTTFLDLAAQIELLDLIRALNRERGRSIVMMLHDLTLAARYSDHLIAMKDGDVVAAGPPAEVITAALLREVFGIEATIVADPLTGAPIVLPDSAVSGPPADGAKHHAPKAARQPLDKLPS